jgi:hypothetical protein
MSIDQARRDLGEWEQGSVESVFSMAEEFGVPNEIVKTDPLKLLGFWDDFLLRLPLDEFDDDDRFWLQSQIAAFISYALIKVHGGHWDVITDRSVPNGFKYVTKVTGWDHQEHNVDVLELAYEGLRHRPPVVTRMMGEAEVAAGVTLNET